MSATNRGFKRIESDFYATPLDTVNTFLNVTNLINPSDRILEPSAGNGNIIKALRESISDKLNIDAYELREEELDNLIDVATNNVYIGDFLNADITRKYDVIIGNPPYSLAQEFVDKSLEVLAPGGRLIFLLRVGFLESKKRRDWWQNKTPSGLYVLSSRPSFTGKGTDATTYAWFVWFKSYTGDYLLNQYNQVIRVI